ncbi:MAG: TlpA family protein disulfide reductase [Flavobacteriales bacterium]|nr:MAG: TlpA family protein disulfide reductase [Flavobacteriales bacterium]
MLFKIKILMRLFLFMIGLVLVISCNSGVSDRLLKGDYVGKLEVENNKYLPFNFSVTNDSTLVVQNSSEIVGFSIDYLKDSIFIRSKVFEGFIKGVLEDNKINGVFVIESLDRSVPFTSYNSSKRFNIDFEKNEKLTLNRWRFTFNPNMDNASISLGIFNPIGQNEISATFRTSTGDYGFMHGGYKDSKIVLSTFNGSRAYLLEAELNNNNDSIKGIMYSGNHSKTIIEGVLDNVFELSNEYSLTSLQSKNQKFEFSFENTAGKLISIDDDIFDGKSMVIQLMGSWCSNCLDESKFYVDYMNKNKLIDIEFVALAFEYAKTKDGALNSILKLKNQIGIDYPILLAQYGSSDKGKALEKFPMLNNIISYPTTIFLDKNKDVIKIHTGFNGPATGEKYIEFINEFDNTIRFMQGN